MDGSEVAGEEETKVGKVGKQKLGNKKKSRFARVGLGFIYSSNELTAQRSDTARRRAVRK